MAVTYAEVVAQAAELSEAERWRLALALISLPAEDVQRSATEFFGINGPVPTDVETRIRLGREG